MTDETPSRLEIVWFAIRHPLKAVALVIAVALGMALTEEVEYNLDLLLVSSGQTAEAHREAHGISEI